MSRGRVFSGIAADDHKGSDVLSEIEAITSVSETTTATLRAEATHDWATRVLDGLIPKMNDPMTSSAPQSFQHASAFRYQDESLGSVLDS